MGTAWNCSGGAQCKCCRALARAREAALFDAYAWARSPLTPGVQAVNLRLDENGQRLSVALGGNWERMFTQLERVGPGLVTTCNSSAAVGQWMIFPKLETIGPGLAVSVNGSLQLNFHQWQEVDAVHLRRESGHAFGVEVIDSWGRLSHWFALTSQSDLEEFVDWVRLHQACAAERSQKETEDDVMVGMGIKSRRLRWEGEAKTLLDILAACGDRKIILQATVRGRAATQRVKFIPQSVRPKDGWWLVSDGTAELHLQAHGKMMVEEHSSGQRESLSVRLQTATENCAVLLQANMLCEHAWQGLLQKVL